MGGEEGRDRPVDVLAASAKVTRSIWSGNPKKLGALTAFKHDFTAGVEARRSVYRTHQEGFDPAAMEQFRQAALPVTCFSCSSRSTSSESWCGRNRRTASSQGW